MLLAETMKNKSEDAMVETYQNFMKRLNDAGIFPKKHILDNKIFKGYKETIDENGMTWELVPVGMHRQNVAEKTAQTFKGHFKYILCGVAEDFPMNLWDRLIPQAELICNILHQSNVAPKVSAQVYAFGPQDFNRMPLARMGCAVQIH